MKKMHSESVLDKRGIKGGHNKISDSQKMDIVNHINKFPKYMSHYRRSDTESVSAYGHHINKNVRFV